MLIIIGVIFTSCTSCTSIPDNQKSECQKGRQTNRKECGDHSPHDLL